MWCKTYNRPVLFHDMATIYFAGGCFWGTEHFMKQIHGVTDTQVGYANSVVESGRDRKSRVRSLYSRT